MTWPPAPASPFGAHSVAHTAEVRRVALLPRRSHPRDSSVAARMAEALTRELKTPRGTMTLRPIQAVALYELMENGGLFAPIYVGGGKCLGAGTPVLMYHGSVKKVEDVCVGDVLMGPDSGPRIVTSTCTGVEELYRIVPVKGEPYVVNASHILSLKSTQKIGDSALLCHRGGRVKNITVTDFINGPADIRANWKGYRTGVEFPASEAPEPYMLGVWLGDGSSKDFSITSADPEIVSEVYAFASRNFAKIRVSEQVGNKSKTYHLSSDTNEAGYYDNGRRKNVTLEWLRLENVLNNKHIPLGYKANSRYTRLEVLAGLLDTDGSYNGRGGFDFISVNRKLSDDVCFVARSLGLAAYMKECRKECVNNGVWGTYWRVSISGNTDMIPCRIASKKASPRRQKKSVLMTGLRAEPIGPGRYYGFELAGADRLFLLGDFTVTHNTLVTLLAPLVLGARRPVLLLPAALIEKTWSDRKALAEHWKLPTNLLLMSYESLSLVQNVKKLDYYKPDFIGADECHYLANARSGRGRRVVRYMKENPDTKFLAASGTMMKKSVLDFGRILRWCLKEKAPIPATDEELSTWAEALDESVNPLQRRRPGALFALEGRLGEDRDEARRIFQRRLLQTSGVVASAGDDVGASILVRALEYTPSPVTEGHFAHVRKLWVTPDGWEFSQAVELRMYLRQLALGFHGVWDPRPPSEWLLARRNWCAFARDILSRSRTLDTPLAVANAVDARLLDDDGALDAWRAVEKTFTIQPKPIWHDDAALEAAKRWMEHERGIVWVEHVFFGHRLSEMTGAPYYGPQGLDRGGNSIKDAAKGPIIASVAACKQGFNLQTFHKNLITCCPSGASTLEQLIGRTHRPGQESDTVYADVMLGCAEQRESFDRALDGARSMRDTMGHKQKILLADIVMPDTGNRKGPLWA